MRTTYRNSTIQNHMVQPEVEKGEGGREHDTKNDTKICQRKIDNMSSTNTGNGAEWSLLRETHVVVVLHVVVDDLLRNIDFLFASVFSRIEVLFVFAGVFVNLEGVVLLCFFVVVVVDVDRLSSERAQRHETHTHNRVRKLHRFDTCT